MLSERAVFAIRLVVFFRDRSIFPCLCDVFCRLRHFTATICWGRSRSNGCRLVITSLIRWTIASWNGTTWASTTSRCIPPLARWLLLVLLMRWKHGIGAQSFRRSLSGHSCWMTSIFRLALQPPFISTLIPGVDSLWWRCATDKVAIRTWNLWNPALEALWDADFHGLLLRLCWWSNLWHIELQLQVISIELEQLRPNLIN